MSLNGLKDTKGIPLLYLLKAMKRKTIGEPSTAPSPEIKKFMNWWPHNIR
jgi:hypothetical protein